MIVLSKQLLIQFFKVLLYFEKCIITLALYLNFKDAYAPLSILTWFF